MTAVEQLVPVPALAHHQLWLLEQLCHQRAGAAGRACGLFHGVDLVLGGRGIARNIDRVDGVDAFRLASEVELAALKAKLKISILFRV